MYASMHPCISVVSPCARCMLYIEAHVPALCHRVLPPAVAPQAEKAKKMDKKSLGFGVETIVRDKRGPLRAAPHRAAPRCALRVHRKRSSPSVGAGAALASWSPPRS
jgi:hypothetical protein